jgi:hypothetical protein
MSSKLPKWCVYQDAWKQWGSDLGIGDGLTAPSRLLVALCDSEEAARAIRDEVAVKNEANTAGLRPGSTARLACLSVGEYDPLEFVGQQARDNYTGQRFANLCRDLAGDAIERRKRLEAGNA